MPKPTIEQTPCKFDCCKTPYRCARGYTCRHHVVQNEANNRAFAAAKKRHTSETSNR